MAETNDTQPSISLEDLEEYLERHTNLCNTTTMTNYVESQLGLHQGKYLTHEQIDYRMSEFLRRIVKCEAELKIDVLPTPVPARMGGGTIFAAETTLQKVSRLGQSLDKEHERVTWLIGEMARLEEAVGQGGRKRRSWWSSLVERMPWRHNSNPADSTNPQS